MPIFTEIALLIVLAVLAGFIAHILKQPVIIGFMAAGFLIGIFKYTELANVAILESLGLNQSISAG